MRIAWFSPFPPVRTGIADCSAELVSALRRRGHTIDPYPAEVAHDFPWIHRQRPYELVVYQFGNSSHHDYEWAYALRYPGLAVLHDACLHHARAAFLLRERRAADYRAEFAWSHPDVPADAAELAVAGFDSRLFYEWPFIKGLVAASKMVAVHGSTANSQLPVPIRLGHGVLVTDAGRGRARRRIRARYGIADDAVLFGLFGGLTPEKRIPQVLDAMRALIPHAPAARLLLAGATAAHFDAAPAIDALGLRDRVITTGYLPEDELTDHLAACDVSLNLRWPTAREISGAWLRALAAGVPTIITDLVHLSGVPSLDPRTWAKNEGAGGWALGAGNSRFPTPDSQLPTTNSQLPTTNSQLPTPNPQPASSNPQPPVCVAIDILDEDHSLRVAMRRLALDADLRARLGRDGQAWWQREHSLDAAVEDYERVMRTAAARPDPQVQLPPHMRDPGDGALRALLAPFGPVARSAIGQFWSQVSGDLAPDLPDCSPGTGTAQSQTRHR